MNRNHIPPFPPGITKGKETQLFEQMTAFSHTAQVSISFYNEKLECVWECLPERKICNIFPSPQTCNSQCHANMLQSRRAALNINDPFISLCACGLVQIIYPLVTNHTIKGTFFVGPIMMGLNREATLRKLIRSFPAFTDFSPEMIAFLEDNSIKTPLEVSYLYDVFCSNLFTSIQAVSSDLDDLYVSNLLHAITSGSDDAAISSFHIFYEKTFLTEFGNQNRIRLHILELFDNLAANMVSDAFLSPEYLDALEAVKKSFTLDELYQNAEGLIVQVTHDNFPTAYSGNSAIVKKAVEHICENFAQDLTLSSLAACINVNQSYLSSLLKRETGFTFSQYLTNIRLNKSLQLLADTHLSITTISMMCGFSNQSYYIKTFKEHYHKTPGQYRREVLKRQN